ncbi:C1 family peptidase [Tenacibaculum sp. nBUS_03]|uniref:C1 family peptidase n=1 Tax=Tenacibaculum sp. nBUS_03 TaxID=3395320 RepID=UPI003EC14603
MRKKSQLFIISLFVIFMYSCEYSYIQLPLENETPPIIVPDVITSQQCPNDPNLTGNICDDTLKNSSLVELINLITIPDSLPSSVDLSTNIPPVRSQGYQSSCVSWATTYYLKSYQEKIQHNYHYSSYKDVMSPSFVYNQTKEDSNCFSGSSIQNALEFLKTQGTVSWEEFPYSDISCSSLPTNKQLTLAKKNKIKEYYYVNVPDTITKKNYTLINLVKTLLYQKQPIVISMDFKNLDFENQNGQYITNTYSKYPIEGLCGHAILIVGYDDKMNAFNIVNSWGTNWGNQGYCWVNYNFFLKKENKDYQKGLTSAYVAYDEDDT